MSLLREKFVCHIMNYYSKSQVDKREVRGLYSWVFISKMTSLRFFQFNPRNKQLLRVSRWQNVGRGRWLQEAVSDETGSLSPSGFEEETKGFNWILNSISSQERFGVHCGLLCKHNRQPCFKIDLYEMVVCLFQSVTEKDTATRPCHFSYKNKTKQKLKMLCLPGSTPQWGNWGRIQ